MNRNGWIEGTEMMGRGALFAFALLALLTADVRADDTPDPMHRVSFQVERSREVTNDWMQAVVGITDEDADSSRLADRINATMTKALATAKRADGVKVKSGGYSTHPVHEKGKLRRWRASQDLILESGDVEAVTKLVGTLQSELQLRSIGFSVSPERRRGIEDELVAEVLAAFRARAEIVRRSLGARSYEIVQISINTQGGAPPRPVRMMAMEMASASQVRAPALEGGSSRIVVHASGTIEFD
ncbi:MAG: SIMPL domain-containing protein [Deltaproteobacteria bacterium]|nr:SIMPL domain-containing protein [Deltaproteobacteria bacterium]MBW2665257.1 SIMPL domain-containing protein [Deltaproteobacteria bacterium]